MRLVKVIAKIYNPDKTIDYLLKYLRSSKRIAFQSIQDCIDLDEILIVTDNMSIVEDLKCYFNTKNSIYILDLELFVLKTFYESNTK